MDVSFFEESPRLKSNQILRQVQSIHTVSEDLITKLQTTLGEGKFVVDKFKVRPQEWHDWYKSNPRLHDIVEYDSLKQYMIIKGKPGPLHDAVTATFKKFFDDLQDLMYGLNRHQAPSKSIQEVPFLALEIGICESTNKLLQNAEHLLTRTTNKKNTVIVVDIQERRPPPIRSFKQFDLSADNIKTLELPQVTDAITKWYQRSKNPLVGEFSVGVYFCYPEGEIVTVYKGDLPTTSLDSIGKVRKPIGNAAAIPYGRLLPALQTKRKIMFPVPVDELLGELQKTLTLVLPHYRAERKALELKKRFAKRRVSKV
ncbi:uncharacterized protein EURHEDRAFT_379410 [Aspergillus ruber CBS 135680]|uniref:Uncharacterized protein n=1 Tax=Aspergillus ruber (strain CBS 135680) TaxID=1388766 RepID=A0A017S9N5_ASPRC|nr:uncharacterized protein EURHEDRAFT_379410 [Aspergillus ruber CBS 135680]EYE93349.1 hypothetical protein EURHEDRAFT_379410 [Aspergillus ruber CBS 135680]